MKKIVAAALSLTLLMLSVAALPVAAQQVSPLDRQTPSEPDALRLFARMVKK